MLKEWKSACPLNCYDVCGLRVTADYNRIVEINGDPTHPVTKGKICGKAKLIIKQIYDKNRLLYPYKKVNNEFIRISWEQAINEISEKMANVKKEYGAKAILYSYDYASGGMLKGLDRRFFNYFGGMTEVNGSLCWGAGIQAQIYDFGDVKCHNVNDIINAKTIIIWGRNITSTNWHLYPFIKKAQNKGARLIVIDPIKTIISKEADLYININPGMDGILALTVSKMIIKNNLHDKTFINQHSVGFEEFFREIEKIDIDLASKEIGIPIETINKLTEVFIKGKPVMSFLGLGIQRYANGGNNIRAIDALSALSGNIGIQGGGVQFANLPVGRSFNWSELTRDDLCKEYRTFSRPEQAEKILNANDPPIKIVFISRSNPVVQLPNINRTIKALEQIDTKIVIDMFMTDTAKYADYILPTTSVFEEEDIYYGSMFHNIIRYGPKIVEAQGESRTELQIWTDLANNLGINGFEKAVEEFLELALKPLNRFGLNLDRLKEKGEFHLPFKSVSWEDKIFNTPSQKFEFYSNIAVQDGASPTAKAIYPLESIQNNKELKEKFPYNLLSIHPVKSLHSQHRLYLNEKPWIIIPQKAAEDNDIKNGDRIKVYNNRGEITGFAKIKDINEKTIVIEEGWWIGTGFSANYLTANTESDLGKGSILYDCAVKLAKE